MKKTLFVMTIFTLGFSCFSLSLSSLFGDKNQVAMVNPAEEIEQITQDYGVTKIKLPIEDAVLFDKEQMEYYSKPTKSSNVTVVPKKEVKQKKARYIIEFFDFGTNTFYDVKTKLRVINPDNQIVQELELPASRIPKYSICDLNFDGFLDLVILEKEDNNQPTYSFFYWNNAKRKFIKDDKTYSTFGLDKKHKFIVENYTNKTGAIFFDFYEFRFGIKRFVASVSFEFNYAQENQQGRVKLYIRDSQTKKKSSVGGFTYLLPQKDVFDSLSDEQKKIEQNQYNKIAHMINAL